jgi:hypothetical protein
LVLVCGSFEVRILEELDDIALKNYISQYIDDIFVKFGDHRSIHLILNNIDNRQYNFSKERKKINFQEILLVIEKYCKNIS